MESANDFLLTRIYEAGKQLSNYPYKKTAIVILDDTLASPRIRAALKLRTDWKNPNLLSTNTKWLDYLQKLKERYPDIESDLPATILSLDEIRIFRLIVNDESLKEEVVVHPNQR